MKWLAVTAGSLALAPAALACEPIVPLVRLFAPASNAFGVGIWLLVAAVVLKCAVFARLQRGLSFGGAFGAMFAANVVSTLCGFVAAFGFAAPALGWIGIALTIAVSWLPSKRAAELLRRPWITPRVVLAAVAAAFLASVVLFIAAQVAGDARSVAGYWILKLSYVWIATAISMLLTTFWEEYVVWHLSRREEPVGFVVPVFRANAVMLFVILLGAAIAVLPERLRQPGFLLALLRFGR